MRLVILGSLAVGLAIAACGSSSDSTFGDGNGDDGGSSSGGDGGDLNFDTGQGDANPYANDPPPQWCGADGGPAAPPPPGGTLNCPDDKNLPGCECDQPNKTAPCWTGLRANRGLGQCKDGTTTCIQKNENDRVWGPCQGEVLPSGGATKGAAACKCFSKGQWKLTNLIPCFYTYSVGGTYAVSTILDATNKAQCPPESNNPPPVAPTTKWTDDTLNVDCAGHFKLCYELKAGDYASPKPTDCSLTKICVEADYLKENVEQPFPDLGPWTSPDATCAAQFAATGGYGEMTVIGLSVRCDKVDDGNGNPYLFNRVQYCKQECMTNPSAPGCANCMQGGSGQF